jgi:hypothetical protein
VTDACVFRCGHIGALQLLELGYTGPLAKRTRWQPASGRACMGHDLRAR